MRGVGTIDPLPLRFLRPWTHDARKTLAVPSYVIDQHPRGPNRVRLYAGESHWTERRAAMRRIPISYTHSISYRFPFPYYHNTVHFVLFWQHIKSLTMHQDASGRVGMDQKASERVRTRQNASDRVRTRQNSLYLFNSMIYIKGNRSMYYWILLISLMLIWDVLWKKSTSDGEHYLHALNIGYPLCY